MKAAKFKVGQAVEAFGISGTIASAEIDLVAVGSRLAKLWAYKIARADGTNLCDVAQVDIQEVK